MLYLCKRYIKIGTTNTSLHCNCVDLIDIDQFVLSFIHGNISVHCVLRLATVYETSKSSRYIVHREKRVLSTPGNPYLQLQFGNMYYHRFYCIYSLCGHNLISKTLGINLRMPLVPSHKYMFHLINIFLR